MASGFPKLPGFGPTQELVCPSSNRRNPTIKRSATPSRNSIGIWYASAYGQSNVEPTYYPLPREQPPAEPDQSRMLNPNYISTTHDHFPPKNAPGDAVHVYQPDWVRLDRHVLRFYGYFK